MRAQHPRTLCHQMSPRKRRLKRSAIVSALARLDELCAASRNRIEIAIYGGTVMMLAYNCRDATQDVDAIFEPPEAVHPLIKQVALEQKLPEDWMNNAVKAFVSNREERITFPEVNAPNVLMTRPSPKYLLAMKCIAARLPTVFRDGDTSDIKFLLSELDIKSMEEVDTIVREFYATRTLENGKRWLIAKLLEEVNSERAARKS